MMNKKKILISMIILLALIFSISYYFTGRYFKNKNADSTNNTTEVSQTKGQSGLDDSTKIYLFAGEKKEKESTIAELKKELNIDGDLTQAQLSKALNQKGYALELASNGELTYKRDASKAVKPNKYYIGEKDGYLAIYKTDNTGTLTIENKEDVYSDGKKFDSLTEGDKTKIKNFEFEYDSKEDAEENLSEFLS